MLAAFMAGLAAGGFSVGRRAHRLGRPLRLYGWLEIGVAVFAVSMPPLLKLVDAAYLAVAPGASGDSGLGVWPSWWIEAGLPVDRASAAERRAQ